MRRLLVALSILGIVLGGLGYGFFIDSASAADDEIDVTGILEIDWGDHSEYSLFVPRTGERYYLQGAGELIAQQGGTFEFNRQTVEVSGVLDTDTSVIHVASIGLVEEIGIRGHTPIGSHFLGNNPYVTLLCKFADSDSEPQLPSHYESLIDTVDDFWNENSYGSVTLDLDGTHEVHGWYELPNERDDYMDNGSMSQSTRTAAVRDCAQQAQDDVDFLDFVGINLFFNEGIGGAWGGTRTLDLSSSGLGLFRSYGVTWMAHSADLRLASHEVGHTFGLPHSSGPYGDTYDSEWDVMSGGRAHTNSYYKYALGWISEDQRYVASGDDNQLIFIEQTAQPNTPLGDNEYLMAHIPIDGSDEFYVVESRRSVGFDTAIPNDPDDPFDLGEAVLMHSVDHDRGSSLNDTPARVVDGNNNGDPNDDGARWLPGDVFEDATNGISLATLNEEDSGYWVMINPDLEISSIDAPEEATAGEDFTVEFSITAGGEPAGFLEGLDARLIVGGMVQHVTIGPDGVVSEDIMRTRAGTLTLRGDFAYLRTDQEEIELLPGPPAVIDLTADPDEQTVGEPVNLAVVVTDEFDNPVADGTDVTFSVDRDDTASVVDGDSWAATTQGGETSIQYTNTLVGTDVVTAIAGDAAQDTNVEWLPGPPANVDLEVDLSEQTVTEPVTVTAHVTDEFDNHVADGTEVVFSVIGTNVEDPVRTDGGSGLTETTVNGVVTLQYTKFFPGTDTITASAGDDPVITSDEALVDWILPESTQNSTIASSGRPLADFTGNASHGRQGGPGGMVRYADNVYDVRANPIEVVTVEGDHGVIYAPAEIDGESLLVRVDVYGDSTTAQIRWPGFDSGEFDIQTANVR